MTHEQIAEQLIERLDNDFLRDDAKEIILAALQSATAEGAHERERLCRALEQCEADNDRIMRERQKAEAQLATIRADTLREAADDVLTIGRPEDQWERWEVVAYLQERAEDLARGPQEGKK